MRVPLNFVSVCGLEGAGKTSAMNTVEQVFRDGGLNVAAPVRSPGGTPVAEAIREIHKSKAYNEKILPETEMYLMAASFMQSYAHRVLPVVDAGETIVGDRNYWCTYAYQVHNRLDPQHAQAVIDTYTAMVRRLEMMVPMQHIFYLDVAPELGMTRARGRGELDRLESQHIAFFHRAREGYLKLAAAEPERCTVIDANVPLEEMLEAVTTAAKRVLKKHAG